ncbi:hypothetical protein SAMN05421543_1474 [Alicyclobacillus macrosporangiidus]|uniref:AAA+ ATPase domain-containing protein n=1 Tax=Alicyclobacillus macrosporangiidus TaxID=392015 RepID=A0A1I7LG70_9BACL|nr:hypothetical protein SAMN05421543_1474 [Alicyclobacillus macrosporangiidus]
MHGQHVEHIEGGALQDSGDPDVSEFNLLRFNLKEGTQRVFQFHWDKTMYVIKSSTEWIKFKRSEWLSTKVFQIHEDFQAYLNDPGVTLYHPRKTKLTLDDTFVYPDAKIINRTDVTDNLERFVSLENVFATLNTENKYMIIGEEKSGKTTVCKILYKNFYDRGYVPVLIDGSKVNSHVLEDFDKLVTQTFMEQYRAEKVEQFRQLSNEKKVILVDNLDRCKLNNRFTYKLVSQLGKLYRHIVLTGSSLFQFMELMTGDDDGDVDVAYQKFELVEFGHKLRYDLVNKWNKLGREYTIEDDELLKENDRVNAILDTIIGYNFVPSYPFFLLVLIQTIESGVQHNLKESSYGYYYDFLITREFMNINLRHEEIDAFYNYVTELAFKFYTKKAKEISEEEFREFNVWFGKEYELSYDLGFMVSRLEAASIIEKFRSSYRFRYPYIYYYFVARYLANNISDDQIKARISFMCEKVHIKEYANILMFLTHMSKDPFILSEIVAKARAIFADVVPTKLENDVASINALVDTLPKLVYETVDVQKHREQRLIARDELERANAETAVELEEDEYEELDIIARLNSAFKSLEILGQILKNYYGSIKADDKYQLCKEAYDLGLRSLNSFLSVLGNNLDGMVSEVHKILEKRRLSSGQSIDRDRIDRISRRFVFNLTLLISYTFIRKISTSIGTKNLMETFRRIVSEDSSVAVRLVDISLRLDYLQFIPFPELEEFIEVARGNALGNTLAKALVLNHMYMFNVSYKDKQRVSDLLDIPIRQQRSIDLLSHRKKS